MSVPKAWTVLCPAGEAHGLETTRKNARALARLLNEAGDECERLGHHRVIRLYLYQLGAMAQVAFRR